jgi:hypothetical protein
MRTLALLGLVACVPTPDPTTGDNELVLVHPSLSPSNVPGTYAAVPAGFFDPSCIAHVHPGESVLADGTIRSADGTIRSVPACTTPSFGPSGSSLEQTSASFAATPSAINGWVESYDTMSGGNLRARSATWIVPEPPSQPTSDEIVYFFNGLENGVDAPPSILQPVLGFSSGQWTATSWNCCKEGTTYHANPIQVNPGDLIVGTMTGAQCNTTTGICDTWQIEAHDQNTGESSVLDTSSWGVPLNWAFAAVLEAYGVASCPQLPASGDLVFGQQAYSTVSGAAATEDWQYGNQVALDCRWNGARDEPGRVTSLGFSGASAPGVTKGASYAFRTLTAPASCIDVYENGSANGTQIEEYSCNSGDAQVFTVESAGTGVVRLHHPSSGKCVTVTGAGTGNGTKIELYTCNGSTAQAFTMTTDAAGNVTFKNPHSGKCLDVAGAGSADLTKIQLYSCNGTNAQRFAPVPGGLAVGGSYELRSAVTGGASCMDVSGDASTDSTAIQEYACNGGGAQELTVVDAGAGLVSLYHADSGKCIDVTSGGTADGTALQLWDCNGTSAQAFAMTTDAVGNVTFKNPHSGRCIDVTGGSTADSTPLQIWDCNGTSAQHWQPVAR